MIEPGRQGFWTVPAGRTASLIDSSAVERPEEACIPAGQGLATLRPPKAGNRRATR